MSDDPLTQVGDLKEAIGRAIDAAGHARFLAQCVEKRTGHGVVKQIAVVLLGARKQLQGAEDSLEKIEDQL